MQHNPLANLLRPQTLNDIVGQEHLLGESGFLMAMLNENKVPSMILYGPPGCGKTTLARLIAQHTDLPFVQLSAISAGVKDIKQIGDAARSDMLSATQVLFVDEIHRFNKAQQDVLLPYVEAGDIILIGATTENPAFSINRALLSRLRVLSLKPIHQDALELIIDRAEQYLQTLSFESDARKALIDIANGDARKLLGTLEILSSSLTGNVDSDAIYQAAGENIGGFSRKGDEYYDLLSAFHKSIRGSSVDGGLFWFARLLLVNEDIVPICRRLLAIASEDIGNADPRALQICLNAWDIYHRVGQAEGERAIAQAIIYCALAPKSNAVYMAFSQAKADAKKHLHEEVPLHLRNAPSQLAKDAGHGKNYQYAHNFEHAYVPAYAYLPEAVGNPHYYTPSDRGLEKSLQEKIEFLSRLDHQG